MVFPKFSKFVLKNRFKKQEPNKPQMCPLYFPCFSYFLEEKAIFIIALDLPWGGKKERERERRVSEQGIGFPHLRYAIDGK